MDFAFTEQQRAVQELAQDFASTHIAPYAAKWDKQAQFPSETLRHAAELGFAAMYCPPEIHGSGLSRLESALVFQALAQACPSTAAYLSIHNMVAWIIAEFAAPELQQQWSAKLARMDAFASYCLTEPSAGSDAANLQTSATADGDDYILNGSKAFISGAGNSDVYLIMARTGAAGAKGISCILVPKDTPGLSFGKPESKLGWRNQPTCTVFLNDCRIPQSNRIGAEGEGFNIAMQALNGGRVNIAACSLGGAQASLDYAINYCHEREQFGQALSQLQALQFKVADMTQQLEAARLLVYRACDSLDKNHDDKITHCAMAKCMATEIGSRVCDQALQLLGGYGYLSDYPIERYWRDLRVHQILEGTNEIMRVILAREALSLQQATKE